VTHSLSGWVSGIPVFSGEGGLFAALQDLINYAELQNEHDEQRRGASER